MAVGGYYQWKQYALIRNMAEPVEPESRWMHKPLTIGTLCLEYLPWFSRSRSFVIRPLCDFSNNDNKLQDSSKLKFCCLREKIAKSPKYQSSISSRIIIPWSNVLKVFHSTHHLSDERSKSPWEKFTVKSKQDCLHGLKKHFYVDESTWHWCSSKYK